MRYTPCLLLLPVLLACSVAASRRDADASASKTTYFDPDQKHPWNRLHRALYSRTIQDGKVYDPESLEPLFLPESKFLTDGASHRDALAVLDEFLKERAEGRIKGPLKRAILQRDLWAVFATTTGAARQHVRFEVNGRTISTDHFEDIGDTKLARRPQRRELQKRLVQVMRRIALTPEEIAALPDNLADAVKAKAFPTAFDSKRRERPFLPADLLAKDGSWVAINHPERDDNGRPAAPAHNGFTKGRSVFTVFLRLPEGRAATEAYLKKGGEFPVGTQTALLRRMLLIDDTGTLRETALTESLQIRVFRKLDTGDPYEFTLRRGELFAGRNGTLHSVGPKETSYFDFQTRLGDVFEMEKRPSAQVVMKTCTDCHTQIDGDGYKSIMTRYGSRDQQPGLVASNPKAQVEATLRWLRKSYTWGLLQGMWETQPAK